MQIINSVKHYGGWKSVFPESGISFPKWAHQIRNYFNEQPNKLKLMDSRYFDLTEKFGRNFLFVLSGETYVDEKGHIWYQMSTQGTGYHFPGQVDWKKVTKTFFLPQRKIPVFKLVSPDGTGGSMEVCIRNSGKDEIGKNGQWVDVRQKVISDKYLGTYNYSETTVAGLGNHIYRDVKPHEKSGRYINPIDPFSIRAHRRFSASLFN